MGDACVICLEPLAADGARLPLQPCGHDQFHPACILQVMRLNGPSCPLCRDAPAPQEGAAEAADLLPAGDVIGIEFADVPDAFRGDLEGMLESIVSHVTEELDQEISADAERRERARRNRWARRDAVVRERRDAYWAARVRRRAAERALAQAGRPLDREVAQLLAKHRTQTRTQRAEVAEARRAETAAETSFHDAADHAAGE